MADSERRLSLRQRRWLKPIPQWRWPTSPRPIVDETLSSYCIRLGAPYRLSLTEVFTSLGIPRAVEAHLIETDPSAALVDRLAATTGRARERFEALQPKPSHPPLLPVAERTAFCSRCWLDRQCAEAAYLDRRWALPYCLTCAIHGGALLQEWPRVEQWPKLFENRSRWQSAENRLPPPVWHATCGALQLDPEQEWQQSECIIRHYEGGAHALVQGVPLPAHLRMYADLVCYLQIQWDPRQRVADLGPPAFSLHEQALCVERFARGVFRSRLTRLIAARHLMRALRSESPSALGEKLMLDIRERKRSHVEEWWLKKNVRSWAGGDRARAVAVFGLTEGRVNERVAFDVCRLCVRETERMRTRVDFYKLFRCAHDPYDVPQCFPETE